MKNKIVWWLPLFAVVLLLTGCQFTDNLKTLFGKNGQNVESVPMITPEGYSSNTTSSVGSATELETVKVMWSGRAELVSTLATKELLNKLYPDYQKVIDWVNNYKNNCSSKSTSKICTPDLSADSIPDPEIILYKVGTLEKNNYPIYYFVLPTLPVIEMGAGQRSALAYFDTNNNKFIGLITNQDLAFSYPSYGIESLPSFISGNVEKLNITGFKDFQLWDENKLVELSPEFISQTNIKIPGDKVTLTPIGYYKNNPWLGWTNIDMLGDFGLDDPLTNKDYSAKINASENFLNNQLEPGLKYQNGCFYKVLSNGSIVGYRVKPYFFENLPEEVAKNLYPASYKATINWQNKNNDKDYYMAYGQVGSCGMNNMDCGELMTTSSWFADDNLVAIGTTNLGEKVYELKNKKDSEFYRNFFNNYGFSAYTNYEDAQKIPEETRWQDFLADQPLFFWKDIWGNWRAYQKVKYQPLAECGKPVIYLYPEKTTEVSVKVEPTGGLTKTEPMYNGGWLVQATPNSELFNYQNQTSYPYLFWEGKAQDLLMPDYGYVLKREEVGTKMPVILAIQGLNEKEIIDFLEFWQSKLEVKPYVFVTFLPQSEFDKMAPLTVEPKPDKVIRVFMEYKPLENKITVPTPRFITPMRTGFTVVEWGGKLN